VAIAKRLKADGKTMPESFEAQAELIWMHLRTILASAGMDHGDLVSLRTYLADPADDEAARTPSR
jgi:2-iminobutanoate/2-iminopropanoate deaminase